MAETNVQPLRRSDEPKSFRLAPHNVEAEQALLGAILVNNEAFYRVSDFLAPEHFYEPIHREIYEIIGKIIRAGKSATPITVKTFLPDNLIADVTMPQYLARLAAEATTVINAGRLRPGDLRPRDPPQPDPHRRGDDLDRLQLRGRGDGAEADRGSRKAALRSRREGPLRRRLPALQRGAQGRHHDGRRGLFARRHAVAAWRPASPTSTA